MTEAWFRRRDVRSVACIGDRLSLIGNADLSCASHAVSQSLMSDERGFIRGALHPDVKINADATLLRYISCQIPAPQLTTQ